MPARYHKKEQKMPPGKDAVENNDAHLEDDEELDVD
jgi:hypothetical protein